MSELENIECPWTPEPSKLFCKDYPEGCESCIKKVEHLKPKMPTYRDTTPIDDLHISLKGKIFLESNDKIIVNLYMKGEKACKRFEHLKAKEKDL